MATKKRPQREPTPEIAEQIERARKAVAGAKRRSEEEKKRAKKVRAKVKRATSRKPVKAGPKAKPHKGGAPPAEFVKPERKRRGPVVVQIRKPPPSKARKKRLRSIEERVRTNTEAASALLRSAWPTTRITERTVLNEDGTLDSAVTGTFQRPPLDSVGLYTIDLENYTSVPNECWISGLFVIWYPPRPEKEYVPGSKKKRRSPHWRRVRTAEGGVEHSTHLHWQRANQKPRHLLALRAMAQNILMAHPRAALRRITLRVYWSESGERPSRNR